MNKIIAIDFDGTLFENNYPQIGLPKWNVINKCKELQQQGYELVLWSCREGKDLKHAVAQCESVGLHFNYVNKNPKWAIKMWKGNDCRKIGADFYVDDKNLSIQEFIDSKFIGD